MYKSILLPLDGSPLAEKALPHAIAIAERFQSELILLRVLIPLPRGPTTNEAALLSAEKETAGLVREYMERIAVSVQERGINVQVIVIGGRPHKEIIQYSESNHINLIVMCTRGESGFSRWLIGSVSDRVMRGANVPVMMVRAVKLEA